MFDVYCPHHQSRVLLGARSIEKLENTADGVLVHWRCRCGARGTLHNSRHGTAASRSSDASAA